MNINDYKITRMPVMIIPYNDRSIFQICEDGICINVSQNERWYNKVTGEEFVVGKVSQYYTQLRIDLRENDYLPGNIYAIYQTDPIDKNDPEYSLYWRDGKVVRNEKGQAIYKFNHYDTIVQYDPIGYIDIHEFEFQ